MPAPRRVLLLAVWGFASAIPSAAVAQETPAPVAWTAADSRLANQYIQLLQQDPAYGKVLDLLWDLYAKKGQTPLLLDYFKGAAESGPEVAALLYAHLLRKSGDEEAARAFYDRVLQGDPQNLPALRALAEIADQQNRMAKALSLYTRLVELVPPDEESALGIRLRKAALHRQQGQTAEAVAEWKALLQAFPDREALRTEVVGLLLEAGETAAAAAALATLAESADPRRRLTALVELSRLHEFAGDFDACLEVSREAMALLHFKSPEYADLFARVVRLHERFHRLPELEEGLAAAAASPNSPERSLHDLAEFHRLTADPVKEEEAVARLATAIPGDAGHRVRLADLQLRNDRYEAAATTLDGLIAEGGTANLPLILRLALVDLQAKGREAAGRRLGGLLDEGDLDAKGRREILEFARSHHLDELVERLLREPGALGEEGGDGFSAPIELARFLHERGRIEPARQALRDYVSAAGNAPLERASRLHRIAGVLKDLGLPGEALAALDEALALVPDQLDYQSARADLYIATKQIDQAVAQLEAIREGRATLEDRAEIDQRLFSLLRGFYATRAAEEEVDKLNVLNQGAIQSLAQYRRLAAAANRASTPGGDEPPPRELIDYFEAIKQAANEAPTTERRYRAAWWAFKMLDNQECYHQLTLANEEAGRPVVEVERMLLTLAEQNERPTLMVRHLSTLIEIDPGNADNYRQRRAEMRFELGFEDEAVRELKEITAKPGAPLATLNTLAKLYQRQGSPGKQVEVWQRAYREADLIGKRAAIKQLAHALVEAGQPEEALKIQIDLMERETDPLQRRKQLDAQITVAQSHFLLDWLRERYAALGVRHPFDRFYPEALARVHRAAGEDREAYEAMRRAYYLSGQGEELLPELAALSDQLGDLDAAIYYRRQLLASGTGDTLENWKELVRMLEKDLRVGEADRLRRRLETKFGSDTDFLAELAGHYAKTGRPHDAGRILSRLVTLRPWDLEARFRLGLVQVALEQREAALATFESILAETSETPWPEGFPDGRLPLVRVSADLAEAAAIAPGLERFVFTVEAYPFAGGNLQDEIADILQRPREEFTPVPKEPHLIRLRAIEEAGALCARLDRVPAWLARWGDGSRPLVERLWATRHAGDGESFSELLGSCPNSGSHADQLLQAYGHLLSGDARRVLAWVKAEDSASGTQHPRSVYTGMAALILLKDGADDPLLREAAVCEVLAGLGLAKNIASHHFSELRKAGRFETAYRVGSLLAESVLADEPAFHFALSQVAGLAGVPLERERWLDRSLAPAASGSGERTPGHFFAALTERLSLLDSDADRSDYLARFASPAVPNPPERASLLALADGDSGEVITQLRRLVEFQARAQRPAAADFDAFGQDQSQGWQRLNRLLHYYSDRLRLDAASGPAFVEAFVTEPLPHSADSTVAAQYEEFEIDRGLLALEWLSAPEREARVRELRGFLKEPESRMELAKALESRGFHREAVPVYRDDAIRRDRDYAPLQGLFDAAAEALDPEPALAVISQINTREFPAPPGLTVDYLNERHARFLLLDRNLERLAQLGRAPVARAGAPPVSSRSHLPYQDALIEACRRFGDDATLLKLLSEMKSRDSASEPQLLLGAEMLARAGRHEEALAWLEPLAQGSSEALLRRRALLLSLESHAALGWQDPAALRTLLLASLGRQPAAVSRLLAVSLHRAGASGEAVGALHLLRRGTGDDAQRTATSQEILRIERESGKTWKDLSGELETFFLDFVYRLEHDDPSRELRDSFPPAEVGPVLPNASRWVEELVAGTEPDRAGLADALDGIHAPERSRWLAGLLLGWCHGRLDPEARHSLSDLDPNSPESWQILETLPAFGPEGVSLARDLVEARGWPGPAFFPNEPERQVAFFHRIGDHARLVEVHSELVRETRSDLFHQSGLEEWVPTLERRRRLPVLFAALGETELARSLFLACDRAIASYQWNHLGFLNDYASFLIESGAFPEAEGLLKQILRKSLRLDLRLLPRLYAAWGKTGEWEQRTRDFHLTRGQEHLLRGWMSALAEGRELRETKDSW